MNGCSARKSALTALATAALFLITGCARSAPPIPATTGPSCEGPLTGRSVVIPSGMAGFGTVQGQPPLPLRAGEYVLTIDDGPNPQTTPSLLAILKARCVAATFMLIGRHAEQSPDLVRTIVADGNSVGSHSYAHGNLSQMTPDARRAEILKGVDAVDIALTGHTRQPGARRLFRIPGAPGVPLHTPPDWMAALRQDHIVLAGLDFSPEDWRNDPAPISFHRLMGELTDRGVILMHDGQPHTLELLPMVLDELQRRHAKVVTLHLTGGDTP